MKKFLSMLVVALMATTAFAQSATELAKIQMEQREQQMKILNLKPTKEAKKQAKQYAKDGWTVPAGKRSLEQQIMESQFYEAELMTDEEGGITNRFIIQPAVQTAGTYNAAYAAARAMAQVELAAMLKTRIAAAMDTELDNAQMSAISAETVDKFHQRSKAVVDGTLTNLRPIMVMYRRLKNNKFEVQISAAVDKKELAARLKRNMKKELETEGDELNSIVDGILKNNQ